MHDNGIIVEHSVSEHHLQYLNECDENFRRNQTDLPSSKKEIKMAKKGQMHPTRLYVSLYFLRSSSNIISFSENTRGAQHIQGKQKCVHMFSLQF